ncbi:hypothetical protein [Loktanella sp. M215]|uniref:hypothetical protein n=1 Tax=Loktanella sp. M215 TaxID=2675431 RepID=UPI001F3775B0|nr:hypothetical protein [Loktanella sp. M215]MCF7702344.1 hypothetical protein [Loktanella sp. M215]
MKVQSRSEFGTGVGTLLKITLAPTIWAFHFVICYAATAVWCTKLTASGDTVTLQTWLIGVTVAALAGILLCGITGWRAWHKGGYGEDGHTPGIGDTESRQRFLGHASVLLSVVSFIGVIFVIAPVLLIGTCA